VWVALEQVHTGLVGSVLHSDGRVRESPLGHLVREFVHRESLGVEPRDRGEAHVFVLEDVLVQTVHAELNQCFLALRY
jgi:hypothetical protein